MKDNKILILPIIAVLISILTFLPHDALGSSYEIQQLNSNGACQALRGSWYNPSSTCTFGSLTINSTDSLKIDSLVTVIVNTGLTNSGTLTNGGTINLNGVSITNNGVFTNNGDIDTNGNKIINNVIGDFTNNGSISFYNFTNSGSLTNNNSMSAISTDTVTKNSGTINNNGVSSAFSAGTVTNTGTINNSVSSTIALGEFTSTNSGVINNMGTIQNLSGGTLTNNLNGVINSNGTITNNSSGSAYLGTINNNGIINNSGTIDNNQNAFLMNGIINNTGTINNSGTVSNSGTINNSGTIQDGCIGTNTGNAVTGNPVLKTCDKTTTTVTPNPSSEALLGTMTFLVKVHDTTISPITPTGAVSWSDGGAGGHFSTPCTLTTASSSTGTCNVVYTAPSSIGSVTINATYPGDLTHKPSSGKSALTVTLRNTATTVTPNPSSVAMGKPITFTGKTSDTSTGTKSAPSGSMTWNDGGVGGIFKVGGVTTNVCNLSSISSTAGSCKVTYTPPPTATVGTVITITATYSGDSTHKISSGTSTLTVFRNTSTVILPSTVSLVHGNSQIFKVNVTDTTTSGTKTAPSGIVSWTASIAGGIFNSLTCTLAPITASISTCQVTYTAPTTTGTDIITGSYGGDSTHIKSAGKSTLTVT